MPAKKKVLKVAKQSIEQYIETTTNNLCDMDLNALFTALDKIKNAHSSDGNEDGFNNIKSAFLAKWSDRVIDLLSLSTSPVGVAKIIQECGALSFAYPPLLDKCISLTSEAIESYDVHQLSVILKGLAQLDYYDENVMPSCLGELKRDMKINTADSHDFSTILWSCAKLRYKDKDFASCWFDVAASKIDFFSQEDLCQSIQGVAKLGEYNEHFIARWIDKVRALDVRSFSPMVQLNSAYYLSMIKLNSAGEDFKPFLDSIIVDLIATVRKKDLKTVEDKRQFLISRNLLPEEKQQELGIREEGYLYTLRADVEVESIPYVSNLQKKIFERAKDIIFVGEKVTSEHWIEEILNHVDFYVGEVRAVMQVDGHPSHYYRNRNGEVNATTDFNTNMLSFFRYSIYRGNDDDLTKREIREFLLPIFRATSVETAEGKSEAPLKDDSDSNMFNHLSSSDDSDNETVLEEKSDTDSSDSAKVAEGRKVSKSPKNTKQIQEAEDNAVIETAILQVAEQDAIYKKLYLAVMRQEIDVVKSYKQYISTSPYPLVDTAAMKNNLEMMRYLLRHSANPNIEGPNGDCAVHIATEKLNVEMLELLADYGARLNVRNKQGKTLLDIYRGLNTALASDKSTNESSAKMIMFFIRQEMVPLDIFFIKINSLGDTLLHLSATWGDDKIVKFWLNKEATKTKVNDKNNQGDTPLHLAALCRDTKVAELLLAKGALVDPENDSRLRPLDHAASHHGGYKMVELLLAKGASVDRAKKDDTPLHYAARSGGDTIAKLLLENGASVDHQGRGGYTPLHIAVLKGHDAVAELLLAKGASVDHQSEDGYTPLHVAIDQGSYKMVELLLEKGASVDHQGPKGHTPLHYAARSGDNTIAALLLEKGASVNLGDQEGLTPLHYAAYGGNYAIAALLLEKGAPVNHQSEDGYTPLYFAAYMERDAIAELLLEKGASVYLQNKDGLTPLQVAIDKGSCKMLALFAAHNRAVLEKAKDHDDDADSHMDEAVTISHEASTQSDDITLSGEIVSYEG